MARLALPEAGLQVHVAAMTPSAGPSTLRLIQAARDGDPEAVDVLFSQAYDELRHLARVVRRRASQETLNTTALVHEAYLKLTPGREMSIQDRAHFLHIVARAMRQVLIDAARRKQAVKRADLAVTAALDAAAPPIQLRALQLVALEDALQQLEDIDPRRANVVECRFFGGMTVPETAEALGISTPTVKRDWRVARAWLADAIR